MRHFHWFIARRYFFAKRSNRFISWVGGVSIIGIALGIIALIITMAILNGFETEVTRRITNFIPHLTVYGNVNTEALLEANPEINAAYRSIERKAILEYGEVKSVLNVRAVEQERWDHLLNEQYNSSIVPGRLSTLGTEQPGIVIGIGVADKLFLSVGDTLLVSSPLDVRAGQFRVPSRHFVVTGIFQSDIFDFDRSLAIIPYQEGRRLFKSAGSDMVIVQLNDYDSAKMIKDRLKVSMPEMEIKTWYDQHRTLFDAMRMEKWGSFIGLNLIILVAVFNIVSSLMMMVLEKTGSIGILRVMGAQAGSIRQIFNLQGLIVAFFGVFLGILIGTLLVLGQAEWQWISLPTDIYLIPVLPVKMYWDEVLLVGVVAFAIVLFSIRYPAKKAARLNPLNAINYKR
ncbi:MAG: ABC transporter permease [Candidatus Marinimicrobia bacterium]|nr:ABC transporter permease [Candidatus Neomarinimicrobiota bacterium]